MNIGPDIDPEYRRIFNLVNAARAKALDYIKKCLNEGLPLRGCDVDALTQSIFQKEGMGSYIMHRTGHNIGITAMGSALT